MNELKAANIRVTVQRQQVLDILKNSEVPLSLNQIKDMIGEGFMDQSTLYRILDLFETKKIVTRTVLLDPSLTVYGYVHKQHRHLLICSRCETISVISGCPLHDYEDQIAEKSGYIINDHQLELYGLCVSCQQEVSL